MGPQWDTYEMSLEGGEGWSIPFGYDDDFPQMEYEAPKRDGKARERTSLGQGLICCFWWCLFVVCSKTN
jgi:hypothetical protein